MKKELPVRTVLATFFDMTGESDATKWLEFCRASCNTILSSLRDDVNVESNIAPLCHAASCHALYMYVLRNCATGIASFRAVDISIAGVDKLTLESAKIIFEDSMAAISDLLKKSPRFAFKSV